MLKQAKIFAGKMYLSLNYAKFSNITNNKSDTQFSFIFLIFGYFIFTTHTHAYTLHIIRSQLLNMVFIPLLWLKLASAHFATTFAGAKKQIKLSFEQKKEPLNKLVPYTKKENHLNNMKRKILLWNLYICFRLVMTSPPWKCHRITTCTMVN